MLAYQSLMVDAVEELEDGGKMITFSPLWKQKDVSDPPIKMAFRNTRKYEWIKDIKVGMLFDITLTPDLDTP